MEPILDYYFECGDFATFNTAHGSMRVRIVGQKWINNEKFYEIAGDQLEMQNLQVDPLPNWFHGQTELPEGWTSVLAEPDELEMPQPHLRLVVNNVGENNG